VTHYGVGVLVGPDVDVGDEDAVVARVSSLMEPYSEHNDVTEYKRYVSEENLELYRENFRIEAGDDANFRKYFYYWFNKRAGIDEQGVYELTVVNPKGQWDSWILYPYFDNLPAVIPVLQFPEDQSMYALVTPDGEWNTRGKVGWWGTSKDDMTRQQWLEHFQQLIKRYPDHFIVTLDCHT
jgi:hypothetical protein